EFREPPPVRLVHDIKGLKKRLVEFKRHLETVERFPQNPIDPSTMVMDTTRAIKILEGVRGRFHSVACDPSHDLRVLRLVELSFAPEGVDSVIRQTGGAKLWLVELGQFYSFVRSWPGGDRDVYVHDLLNEFNEILVRRGLVLPHHRAPLL